MITLIVTLLAVMVFAAGQEISRPFWRAVFELTLFGLFWLIIMEVNEWPDLLNW